MATTQNPSQGEWQMVMRRRRFPDVWRSTTSNSPTSVLAKPYIPFMSKPTYAQVFLSDQLRTTEATRRPTATMPKPPQTLHDTSYYVSQHNPAKLRFSPSPGFPEWKGRRFKCCKIGHKAVLCRNSIRCGRCWGEGHTGSRCKTATLNPTAPPYRPVRPIVNKEFEPKFDETLRGPNHPATPVLPENRPTRTVCYIDRDADYFQEVDRLSKAIVFEAEHVRPAPSIDDIAKCVATSDMVQLEDLSIGIMARSKFLVVLPEAIDPRAVGHPFRLLSGIWVIRYRYGIPYRRPLWSSLTK